MDHHSPNRIIDSVGEVSFAFGTLGAATLRPFLDVIVCPRVVARTPEYGTDRADEPPSRPSGK